MNLVRMASRIKVKISTIVTFPPVEKLPDLQKIKSICSHSSTLPSPFDMNYDAYVSKP